jgi:hypothetical protein
LRDEFKNFDGQDHVFPNINGNEDWFDYQKLAWWWFFKLFSQISRHA